MPRKPNPDVGRKRHTRRANPKKRYRRTGNALSRWENEQLTMRILSLYQAGYSVPEIARIINSSEHLVKIRLTRNASTIETFRNRTFTSITRHQVTELLSSRDHLIGHARAAAEILTNLLKSPEELASLGITPPTRLSFEAATEILDRVGITQKAGETLTATTSSQQSTTITEDMAKALLHALQGLQAPPPTLEIPTIILDETTPITTAPKSLPPTSEPTNDQLGT